GRFRSGRRTMTAPALPVRVRALIEEYADGDRSTALALHALITVAGADGIARFDDVTLRYRDDYLQVLRVEGRDAEREAGRLSLDEVRSHLATSVFPRLTGDGLVEIDSGGLEQPDARIRVAEVLWREIAPQRGMIADALRRTGEHSTLPTAVEKVATRDGAVLEAEGLTKVYRRRRVVNDVALRLQQGEIVGLLRPNGAGKTTTYYMIVGLISPLTGRILLDGEDITNMPMYQRARRGIGYLSQEPSIFRKLTVEE